MFLPADKTVNLPAPNLKAPVSSLAEIEWKEGSLFVPRNSNFKTSHGFLDSSTMLQVTCASIHGINSDGLIQASRVGTDLCEHLTGDSDEALLALAVNRSTEWPAQQRD